MCREHLAFAFVSILLSLIGVVAMVLSAEELSEQVQRATTTTATTKPAQP